MDQGDSEMKLELLEFEKIKRGGIFFSVFKDNY